MALESRDILRIQKEKFNGTSQKSTEFTGLTKSLGKLNRSKMRQTIHVRIKL